jgi:uncharacterized radical SAM superfamily Fe-S cluster-containing enzyme
VNDTAYKAFLELKTQILENSKFSNVLRFDCMNPYKSLSFLVNKVKRTNTINFAKWYKLEKKHFEFFSVGVRDSLFGIMCADPKSTYILPKHVYPVYQQIAQSAKVETIHYNTYPICDMNSISLPDGNFTLLITNPTVPNGTRLNLTDVSILLKWLNRSTTHKIIIDAVYQTEIIMENSMLLTHPQVTYLNSLSKSHLAPLELGIVMTDISEHACAIHHIAETRDEKTVKVDLHTPLEQQKLFDFRWSRAVSILGKFDWIPPQSGYFTSVNVPFDKLLNEHKILGIPPAVFGSTDTSHTILTCLHESLDAQLDKIFGKKRIRYHVMPTSSFAKGYDKYSRRWSKQSDSPFKHVVFLVDENKLNIGVKKVGKTSHIIVKTTLSNTDVLKHNYLTGTRLGEYVNKKDIKVDTVYRLVDGVLKQMSVEDAYAESMKLAFNTDKIGYNYDALIPRTISFLPVAKGCQAKCPFCFSHASISDDQKQSVLSTDVIDTLCKKAKVKGAERAVITGGGEPMILPFKKVVSMVDTIGRNYDKLIMITNGFALSKCDPHQTLEMLSTLETAGLTNLCVSRHGYTEDVNTKIMFLKTEADKISKILYDNRDKIKYLNMRWVCVLQRGGVDSVDNLIKYLDWTVDTGVSEICFKELYVASSHESLYYDKASNLWSEKHQVPLSMIVDFLESMDATVVDKLPWGSPVYLLTWRGVKLKIACYTEPNLYWELSNGVCRSWNVMADGACYSSLEDKRSKITTNSFFI